MALIADLVARVIFFCDGQALGDVTEVGAGAEEVENGGTGRGVVGGGRVHWQLRQAGVSVVAGGWTVWRAVALTK